MPITDEQGNVTMLEFASQNDRVFKTGKTTHKVVDKLNISSDNISKLAVIHIDEIVSVSEENSPYYSDENNHDWLDKNGWLHRNANVINKKNVNIYKLTLDIAKTADGRTILYATDGKIKKVGTVHVNSLKTKGSGPNSNFTNSISHSPQKVNTSEKNNYPFSDNAKKAMSKKDVEAFAESARNLYEDATKDLKGKALENIERCERDFVRKVGEIMKLPSDFKRGVLHDIAKGIIAEQINGGTRTIFIRYLKKYNSCTD